MTLPRKTLEHGRCTLSEVSYRAYLAFIGVLRHSEEHYPLCPHCGVRTRARDGTLEHIDGREIIAIPLE